MKFLIAIVVLIALSEAALIQNDNLSNEWNQFKIQFNKNYESNAHELERRLIWEDNYRKINQHNDEYNSGKHTFYLKMNHFGDLTTKEFATQMNGFKQSVPKQSGDKYVPTIKDIPQQVDWRDKGLVTNVKNQGMCGSCWAFSAVGSLEGQHAKKSGNLISLSVQNLVDCSNDEGNEGCNGGLMDQAFEYIEKVHGIDTDAAYPYVGLRGGKCKFDQNSIGATLTGYKDIESGNEDDLTKAIAEVGPIAVAIDASSFMFQFYFGGVYYSGSCSSTELDHGVLAAGYGTYKGKDYYLVKNSWGSWWGKHGYIMMSRGRDNNCGIATNASFPLV